VASGYDIGLTEGALPSSRLSGKKHEAPSWPQDIPGNAFGSLGLWQVPSFRDLLSAGGDFPSLGKGPSAGLHALRLTHHFKDFPHSPEQPLQSVLRIKDQARHGRTLQETQSSKAPSSGATFPNGCVELPWPFHLNRPRGLAWMPPPALHLQGWPQL